MSIEPYPLHEEVVKMAVLSPLLFLAGFFRSPFFPKAEVEVQISADDEGVTIRGRLDILVLMNRVWVVTIESKNKDFSLAKGLPQLLTDMMSQVTEQEPVFGLITNGSHFRFAKIVNQPSAIYACSQEFSLYRDTNELYTVLQILKRLGQLVAGRDRSELVRPAA